MPLIYVFLEVVLISKRQIGICKETILLPFLFYFSRYKNEQNSRPVCSYIYIFNNINTYVSHVSSQGI
jgi:hypothetical protein